MKDIAFNVGRARVTFLIRNPDTDKLVWGWDWNERGYDGYYYTYGIYPLFEVMVIAKDLIEEIERRQEAAAALEEE